MTIATPSTLAEYSKTLIIFFWFFGVRPSAWFQMSVDTTRADVRTIVTCLSSLQTTRAKGANNDCSSWSLSGLLSILRLLNKVLAIMVGWLRAEKWMEEKREWIVEFSENNNRLPAADANDPIFHGNLVFASFTRKKRDEEGSKQGEVEAEVNQLEANRQNGLFRPLDET